MARCFHGSSVAAAVLCAAALGAQAQPPDGWGWLVYPCVRAETPPSLDGRLDDPVWQAAVPASGFRFSASQSMAPYQLVMKLAWDQDWLYLAVVIEEPAMDKLVITAHGRDAYVFNDDSIEWFVDPWHGQGMYYQFGLNVAGAMWDSQIGERAWDCDWRAAVARGEDAWFAECAMPLQQWGKRLLGTGDVWGFNLCHERQAGGSRELINWANVMGDFHRLGLFGHLVFLDSPAELEPGLMGRVAGKIGRPARFFTATGWWQVDDEVRATTYQEDLRQAIKVRLGEPLREVRDALDREEQPELWAEYRALADEWYEVRRLGDRAVDAVEWAHARPALDGLETRVPELLWKVKLAELLQSL